MGIRAAILIQSLPSTFFSPALARWRIRCAAFVVGVAAACAGPAHALLFSFNTTALSGTSARLEFSLFDGDFSGNNSVTIASLTTNGSLGAVDCTVGCTGGPPYTIDDAIGLGSYLQDLTLGTVFSFNLTFTTNFSGSGDPDRLVVSLLDPGTNLTLVDTDLDLVSGAVGTQDAILVLDLVAGSKAQLPTVSTPGLPGAIIPAPGSAVLFGLGLAMLAMRRIRAGRLSVSG